MAGEGCWEALPSVLKLEDLLSPSWRKLFTLRAVPPTQLSLVRASLLEGSCPVHPTSISVFARLSAHCAYRRV